jgi:predicted nucleotidyltransferase
MSIYGWDNCPEQNQKQIGSLRDKLIEYLDTNLIGIYLHGSLALDSFNPEVSDLDVIVLLNETINMDLRFELVQVLLDLSNHPSPIEISFITKNAIWPWKHPTPFELHSSEYWRNTYEEQVRMKNKHFWAETREDSDLACHITLINQIGICLYGTPIGQAFPTVPEKDFRSSILSDVNYAASVLNTLPVYGILTLCRVLSYLETGQILSKGRAGEWVLPLIPENMRYIVVQAVHTYIGTGNPNMHMDEDDLEQFKKLMLSKIYNERQAPLKINE